MARLGADFYGFVGWFRKVRQEIDFTSTRESFLKKDETKLKNLSISLQRREKNLLW